MREIGSIFPIGLQNGSECGRGLNFGSSVKLYSLCREALLSFLLAINPQQKVALLPAYTCSTVIDPFAQLGWDISFYSINKDLSLNVDSLLSQAHRCGPSVVLFHPYYGTDYSIQELDAIKLLKEGGCQTVEDLTQNLFAPKHEEVFTCRVGSIRKWFPIPDGGFLDAPIEVDGCSLPYESFYLPQLVAMKLRAKYFETGDAELKALSIQLNKYAVRHAREPLSAHAVSDYTLAALENVNVEGCIETRLDNFSTLLNGLVDCLNVTLPIRDMRRLAGAPLYFPLYVHGSREAFQSQIAARAVYAPILWVPASGDVLVDDTVRMIYDRILAIPCDQRYSREDMLRVVEAIKTVES